MVTLKPMNHQDFQNYINSSIENFAKEKVTAGNWNEEEALDNSREEFNRLLPQAEKTEYNYLFSIFNGNSKIGVIWLAHKSPSHKNEGFIYDLVIYDQFQGTGYGKETLKELESMARGYGIDTIGLHVFGHNIGARKLYEKMGYEAKNIIMEKRI